MSQFEIYKLLEKNKLKWFDIYDIATALSIGKSSISLNRKRLINAGLVDYKYDRKKYENNGRSYSKQVLFIRFKNKLDKK